MLRRKEMKMKMKILAFVAFVGLIAAENLFFWRLENRLETAFSKEVAVMTARIEALERKLESCQKGEAGECNRQAEQDQALAAKKAEEARIAAEKAAAKREAERKAAEKRAAEKREAERRAAAEKAAAAKAAAAKRDAERKAAEKAAAEKREAEKRETERRAAEEKAAAEKAAAKKTDSKPESPKAVEELREPEKADEPAKVEEPEKAKEPERVKCPNCGGAGTVEEDPSTCSKCGGTGKVTVLKRKYKHNGFYRTGVFKTTEVVEDCPLCAARKAEKKKCVRCQGTGIVEAASSDKSGD